jgi:AraC family transcriptional regulator
MDAIYGLSLALKHIEDHLQDKLGLEELADVANYSAWHFHRLFTAYVGYGVSDYIRRRRLSEASQELIFTSRPIKEIAGSYGFDSQEAFTRAFKSYSGVTPGYARKQKGPLIRFSAINLVLYSRHFRKGDIIMIPRIEHREAFTVVGLAGQFTLENNTIPQLWDKFNPRAMEIRDAQYDCCLGLCSYEPDYEKGKPFTYMAGRIVSRVSDIPQGMTVREVPACDYAVFEHKGPLDTLQKTYDYIYREWLPASEYEMAPHDDFEWYDYRFKFGQPDSILEIWIPIKKK